MPDRFKEGDVIEADGIAWTLFEIDGSLDFANAVAALVATDETYLASAAKDFIGMAERNLAGDKASLTSFQIDSWRKEFLLAFELDAATNQQEAGA